MDLFKLVHLGIPASVPTPNSLLTWDLPAPPFIYWPVDCWPLTERPSCYHLQMKFVKVIFLHVSVILSTGTSAISACVAGSIPACLAAGLWGGGGVPACLAGFQAHTQGESLGGSDWGSPGPYPRGSWGGSGPGPQPRGKFRGIWSRSIPKGEVEGDLAGGYLLGECLLPGGRIWRPTMMATAGAIRILLECILVRYWFHAIKINQEEKCLLVIGEFRSKSALYTF